MRAMLVCLVLLAGCDATGTLVVQVRTDLTPGNELGAVEVVMTTPSGITYVDRVAASAERDWGGGVRIAERSGLELGGHRLLVRAEDPVGGRVLERPVRVQLGEGVTVVTVLLTRDCVGVECPDTGDSSSATACLAGRCVEETCAEETPGGCGTPTCSADTECMSSTSCSVPECNDTGACFESPDHRMCMAGEVCAIGTGCVPIDATPDAGPPDGGVIDGGPGAGCFPFQIVAGGFHTCVRCVSGETYCWGSNTGGQLGDGTTTSRDAPALATALGTSSADIATGGSERFGGRDLPSHTCVRQAATGVVACLGDREYGQVGDTTIASDSARLDLFEHDMMTARAADLALGGFHSCMVLDTGEVWCWGRNLVGAVGQASPENIGSPTLVASIPAIASLGAGSWHTCAVARTEAVYCWGANDAGQLGFPIPPDRSAPGVVPGVAASRVCGGESHSCALSAGRQIYCWGYGGYVGTSSVTADLFQAPVLAEVSGVIDFDCGTEHTCTVSTAGQVFCFGLADGGRLGTSDTGEMQTPVRVPGIDNADRVAAGREHTCVITGDGPDPGSAPDVWCWGDDTRGQLGDGMRDSSGSTPVQVIGLD